MGIFNARSKFSVSFFSFKNWNSYHDRTDVSIHLMKYHVSSILLMLKCVHIDTSCVNISPAVIYLLFKHTKKYQLSKRPIITDFYTHTNYILTWYLFYISHTCCILNNFHPCTLFVVLWICVDIFVIIFYVKMHQQHLFNG